MSSFPGMVYHYEVEVLDLLKKTGEYLPPKAQATIERAYDFAAKAHNSQVRLSGEPYIQHPLHTAYTLALLQQDAECITAAVLHDVSEDCGVPIADIEKQFGPQVAKLVDGVTKISRISWPALETTRKSAEDGLAQAENLRKMLLAMAEDVRVVLIKLADRLHNMRTLAVLPAEKRMRISRQTLEIYAPLANRLGIWDIRSQLEDLAFMHLEPEKYREVSHMVAGRSAASEKYFEQVFEILKTEMAKAGVEAEISGRPKHIYSIYKKMERYNAEGKPIAQIYDLMAVRIIVHEVQDCYSALGVVHGLWTPISGQFDDYIAAPKESMYQSLHTTVVGPEARPLEVQIRTHEMHHISEYGIAAHWRYKEGVKQDPKYDQKLAWLRQLLNWHKEVAGAEEFVDLIKTDVFRDQVYVFTPKGEIKDLPVGSTPLDFAYRIHTDLGQKCIGAKVNGRLVPLNYKLITGDAVEIVSSKNAKGPSLDWLNPHLGYARTSHAREKIRQWFRKQERTENIERGRGVLEKELKHLGIKPVGDDEIARLFKYERSDDFLAALGSGDITTHQIAVKLIPEEPAPMKIVEASQVVPSGFTGVEVMGVGDLLTHLARCCGPVPGDEIIGFITRTKGVTVHRKDCANVINVWEKERLIKVNWGRARQKAYPVSVRIEAWDRVGLLRDISTLVSGEKSNIVSVNLSQPDNSSVHIALIFETTGMEQLSRILTKLETIPGILNVARDSN
ncbi:MAG: bifunctional (p)ppGpp synthetase/guanosine-3',5'-bis(diphosphate) 3'-pyrophosphohydrolase [Dehalococcoidia bacterium]|nr:bifunctional (p)ppGpp synthetase/guanosine-3',5'-bis(diphosphate) 3'-pyrophosphohydrolase [Dehalococcoidia bacterium]